MGMEAGLGRVSVPPSRSSRLRGLGTLLSPAFQPASAPGWPRLAGWGAACGDMLPAPPEPSLSTAPEPSLQTCSGR